MVVFNAFILVSGWLFLVSDGFLAREIDCFDTRILGFDTRILDFDTRNLGFDTRILGFDTRNLGFDTRFFGFDTRNLGFDTRFLGSSAGIFALHRGFDVRNCGEPARDGRGGTVAVFGWLCGWGSNGTPAQPDRCRSLGGFFWVVGAAGDDAKSNSE